MKKTNSGSANPESENYQKPVEQSMVINTKHTILPVQIIQVYWDWSTENTLTRRMQGIVGLA